MQPNQFLVGQRTAADAPIPTVASIAVNAVTGAALLWLVPRLLPVGTPWAIRFWIALVGFCFLFLVARLDFWTLIFRALGFAVEKLWDCPSARSSIPASSTDISCRCCRPPACRDCNASVIGSNFCDRRNEEQQGDRDRVEPCTPSWPPGSASNRLHRCTRS
jgi:hypothetical protein